MRRSVGEWDCSGEDLELLSRLLRLARLDVERDEFLQLCVRVKKARSLISQVKAYNSVNVRPLYYVWDQLLDPPEFIAKDAADVSSLTRGRTKEGFVVVPWRGG